MAQSMVEEYGVKGIEDLRLTWRRGPPRDGAPSVMRSFMRKSFRSFSQLGNREMSAREVECIAREIDNTNS